MTASEILDVMPILQVRHVGKSCDYYREALGFRVNGVWGEDKSDPAFAIIQRGPVTLALDHSQSPEIPTNQWWAAYIYVSNVDALYAELLRTGAKVEGPPKDTFYGCRDFDVMDLDGHRLCFGQDMEVD